MKRKIKVYYSAAFARKDEAIRLAKDLAPFCDNTSRWMHRGNIQYGMNRLYGEEDVIDIRKCDLMIQFINDPPDKSTRGGRHVELGVAIAFSKPVLLIGREHENPFQLPYWVGGEADIQRAILEHMLDGRLRLGE